MDQALLQGQIVPRQQTKPQPSCKLTHSIDMLRVKADVIWLVKYELEVEVERWTMQQDLLDEKSVIANT